MAEDFPLTSNGSSNPLHDISKYLSELSQSSQSMSSRMFRMEEQLQTCLSQLDEERQLRTEAEFRLQVTFNYLFLFSSQTFFKTFYYYVCGVFISY